MCDLGDGQLHRVCCRWGRGFGLLQYFVDKENPLNQPNSVLGIIFYSLQMVLGLPLSRKAAVFLVFSSWVSVAGSLYLAQRILAFVLAVNSVWSVSPRMSSNSHCFSPT
uniref:Vitamin K epoxide reductase complex, subunit 1 n=1 Tax=Tetraodon nigroviridis TaxID=99883 RepID=H3CL33_TETNG